MEYFRKKVITSLGWTVSSRMATELMQLVITIVLARLLTPKDYGLVGMSASFMIFIQNFSHLGFWAPLIQIDHIQKKHYSTAFWSMVFSSGMLFGLAYLCAPFVASFFNEELLTKIVRVSAISLIFISLNSVPFAIMERSLEYKKVAIIEIIRKIAIGGVGITLALNGYGVWALVLGGLAGNILVIPIAWRYARWWPQVLFNKEAFGELYSFGVKITIGGILSLVSRNLDNIIIGRFLGASALGYYSLAYGLMLRPLQYINDAVGRVFFPAFSSIQNDTVRIRNAYLKLLQGISLLVFPMMTGMLFVAPVFIEVVYGSKWLPAAPVLQVLCLAGAMQSIGGTAGSIFLSQGRPDLDLKFKMISCPVFAFAFIIGVHYGIVGVATAYAIAYLGLCLWPLLAANRLIALGSQQFLKQLMPAIRACAGMLAVLILSDYIQLNILHWDIALGISLFGFIAVGVISYCALLCILENNTVKKMLYQFKSLYESKV